MHAAHRTEGGSKVALLLVVACFVLVPGASRLKTSARQSGVPASSFFP